MRGARRGVSAQDTVAVTRRGQPVLGVLSPAVTCSLTLSLKVCPPVVQEESEKLNL